MEKDAITINRDDLYKQVWSEPISKLAPKYGISDVGLKKICRKLNIPTPPRGYWAKIQNNIIVEKMPLPKLKHGEQGTYTVQGKPETHKDDPNLSAEANLIISEIERLENIKVPKRLNSPHPLIRNTRSALSSAKPDKYGILRIWRKQCLDIRVSANLLNRALRIMNGIIRFFEKHGYEISIGDGYQTQIGSYIKIFGEKVPIYIHERSNRQDHVLTAKEEQELKRGYHHFIDKYDYIPSGKLNLYIEAWGCRTQSIRKRWSDCKKQRVENLLKDFAINVVKVADLKRTARIERKERERRWEEERRRQAELERLLQIEEERRRDLENQAERWFKSKRLREYIIAVEKSAAKTEYGNQLEKWLAWAKAHADRIDPLNNVLPIEFDLS